MGNPVASQDGTDALAQQIVASKTHDSALSHIIGHFGADSGTVHFIEADRLLHLAACSSGTPQAVLEKIAVIPIGKGMAGLAVERRSPVDACNIQTDTTGDVRPGARATGMAGAIVVPIFHGDEVVGALGIANRSERVFTPDEIEALIEAGRTLGRQRAGAI